MHLLFLLHSFILIPSELQFRNNLFDRLTLSDSVVYWEFREYNRPNNGVNYDITFKRGANNYQIQDTEPNYLDINLTEGLCAIVYVLKNDSVYYLTKNSRLNQFLGKIDNIEDVLFCAMLNGFWFEVNKKKWGSYKRVNDGFLLNVVEMLPFSDCVDYYKYKCIPKKIKVYNDGSVKIYEK
jgi:hypothetical protein